MLSSVEEKRSYALGLMISERVLKQYDEIDYQFLLHGLTNHQEGKTAPVNPGRSRTDAEQTSTVDKRRVSLGHKKSWLSPAFFMPER